MTSYSTSSNGRLHKRGHSASSVSPPSVPYSPPLGPEPHSYRYRPADGSKLSYEDVIAEEKSASQMATSFKIKPYLRKRSLRDENRIDLSRPTAENEGLAGLGIQDFNAAPRSASDVNFVPVSSSRTRHNRSTSGNSQFSTSSGVKSPSMPYQHPMRHTPRPYTPPISKSYTTSVIGSEISDEPADILSDDEFRHRQLRLDAKLRSNSVSSMPVAPPPLHIHTGGSLTRLNNPSQSSIPSSMPTGRSRGATIQSVDTCVSPTSTSRTSVDKAIGFIRGNRGDEPVDPAGRAASIRAARIAYNEREEAKERKAEQESLRRQDRENRRRGKQEERQRRRSDADERRRRARANSSSEKLGAFASKGYHDTSEAHVRSLPTQVEAPPTPAVFSTQSKSSSSQKRGAKSGWVAFMAWFRTRLLRLGRMLHLR